MNISIAPGSKVMADEARSLFGEGRVEEGGFRSPILLKDLTEDEVDFASDYFREQGKQVSVTA